jgi:hypothetical protein
MNDHMRDLMYRDEPEQTRDLVERALTVRAATVDAQNRSVEMVMASGGRVNVYDWMRDEVIEEVLVPGGGTMPEQMPLLECHARWSLDAVLGSWRQIRLEEQQWVGRAYFASDARSMAAWEKVAKGHLTDCSIGYRVIESTMLEPGQKGLVNGTEYAAGNLPLRIASKWEARECSLVPVGADKRAKVREQTNRGGPPQKDRDSMNPTLRRYLESLGLRADASEKEAQAYWKALKGAQRAIAEGIEARTIDEAEVMQIIRSAPNAPNAPTPAPATPAATPAAGPAATDPETLRREAVTAERNRQSRLRELAGSDVPEDVLKRAIDEGWDEPTASRQFLTAIRAARTAAVASDNGRAPAGIVRDPQREMTLGVLCFAMAQRAVLGTDERRIKMWAQRQGIADWAQMASRADRYRDMSALDVCREALRLDGTRVPHGRDETIRAAVSGGALSNIFTDSMHAVIAVAYDEEGDSTDWVQEGEAPDFKTQTAVKFGVNAALEKLGRGGTAKHADVEDSAETYKISRYAKKLIFDEQDIIDDNFGKLQEGGAELGQSARRVRPNLVYAILLANPTMADSGVLFNSTALTTAGGHANYAASGSDVAGGALGVGSLEGAFTTMRKQYMIKGTDKVALNLVPTTLVVPSDLEFTASKLINSAELLPISTAGGPTFNALKGRLQLRVEQRIGALGFKDPDSGTLYTGTATNYFLFSRAGYHIKVIYLSGTNRGPVVRPFTLDQGQWGLGWDVKIDVGAKATDFRGAYKAKGSA